MRPLVALTASPTSTPWRKSHGPIPATAVKAHNTAIHNLLSQGSLGVTPSEVIHGVRPLLQDALTEGHIQDSIAGADPGSQQHLEAVAGAHNKAREYAIECRAAYEQRLRDDVRNVLRNKTSFAQCHRDIVRVGRTDSEEQALGRKMKKLTPANSEGMVFIESLGFGRYTLQTTGKHESDVISRSSDLIQKVLVRSPNTEACQSAEAPAQQTLRANRDHDHEYVVDAITGERGVIAHKTKQYKVKRQDYGEETCIDHTAIDKKCQPWLDYKNTQETPSTQCGQHCDGSSRPAGDASRHTDITDMQGSRHRRI